MTHRWRFSWAWTIAAVLVLPGCFSLPAPAPSPSSCPELGLPWCHEAGISCGECQHQPPGKTCPVKAPPCATPPPAGPTPAPSPTVGSPPAPPAGDCKAPVPPRFWTRDTLPDGWGEDQIGKPRWELNCQKHGRVVDCTPIVAPRACEYCAAIGMGFYPDGQWRCGCPVRPECGIGDLPDAICHQRPACEAYLLGGGTFLKSLDGKPCERSSDNPLQFLPRDGQCRLCSADGQVCGAAF